MAIKMYSIARANYTVCQAHSEWTLLWCVLL